MKKVITTFFAALFLVSFSGRQEKVYKVELPQFKWINYVNGIEFAKQQLKVSDLPSKVVTAIIDSVLAPLQNDIVIQVNQQIKKDSVIKK